MIALRVNGRPVQLDEPTPLPDYLRGLGVDPRAIAVEVNGEILPRDRYAACTLRDGDVVEIVRMVGGGRPAAAAGRDEGRSVATGAGRRGRSDPIHARADGAHGLHEPLPHRGPPAAVPHDEPGHRSQ
jgi:sulfur carrier protein